MSGQEASLDIIIISFGSADIIESNMLDVLKCEKIKKSIIENNPFHKSSKKLEKYPNLHVSVQEENIGFGSGINLATSQSDSVYNLILNPDIIITLSEIQKFLFYAKNESYENTILWAPSKYNHGRQSKNFFVSGSIMMFRRQEFLEAGGFDENIFLFFEETDLCKRILEKNLRISTEADISFDHLSGKSSPNDTKIEIFKNWHFGWSKCYYYRKHFPNIKKKAALCIFINYLMKYLFSFNRSKSILNKAKACGAWAFLNGKSSRECHINLI